MKVTLGGDRLGAGKKEKIHLRNYERSTHDLSYAWRSTMSAGTLVPFLTEVGLPGDTFEIDLNVDIMTHPTIGPLFGSYKVQIDLFSVPIRLYNAKLHMNMLGIGLDMSQIKLPQLELEQPSQTAEEVKELVEEGKWENSQINPSSILSHLNIRGVGNNQSGDIQTRDFNAIPFLAYWDIYKNYYANKQEEIGMVIHRAVSDQSITPFQVQSTVNNTDWTNLQPDSKNNASTDSFTSSETIPGIRLTFGKAVSEQEAIEWYEKAIIAIGGDSVPLEIQVYETQQGYGVKMSDFFSGTPFWSESAPTQNTLTIQGNDWAAPFGAGDWTGVMYGWTTEAAIATRTGEVEIIDFELENIDNMRTQILQFAGNSAFKLNGNSPTPYKYIFDSFTDDKNVTTYSRQNSQEGLALKTYQSDLFNNWISTEWIDGDNGINQVTALSTTDDYITIDQINLSRKIYDMLNRIALSGGSYDNWLDATYTHDRAKSVENPIYMGGLSQELVFEEVISTADTNENPLGTLAGRGRLGGKRKGGNAYIKVDEPSYIMGIVSLTPRIDYSQGNKWDTDLKTLDDFHKPALGEIGFQDLITEQMAWYDTILEGNGEQNRKSAGKQPAWINYMTNVNVTRGNFANETEQMWMTLNRKYGATESGEIKDLTTYVDPSKFNHIFADTRLDAMNFWAQIGVGIKARRKMSAKVMPNL